jgi:asparagine synthase (glutamine-hydrolysing)
MCGIAGVINKTPSKIDIKECIGSFQRSMDHRGPDDSGYHIGKDHGFLNLRLAIVDIACGQQPIFNKDKSVGIVYNGEVYNFGDLRTELIKKGHSFNTHSDTEVILRAYEEYGVDSFKKLNGMFAFCLWDNRKDVVYLVRDYFGIKPLYIYEDEKRLIFSSELKGILGIPDIDLTLNPAGFQDYFMFRYVQAPYSFFKKIRRLDAGTYLEIKNGKTVQYRYWDISYNDPYPHNSVNEIKETLLRKMQKAVESQLMGEVPIGVLLSGGVDSSAIAYFINRCGANLTTFNIGFPEVNEFEYSREVAKKFGLKHVEILTTTDELLASFDKIMLAIDEPIADPACLPLYSLCEELKKHVTVVLSGEGGDELFAGYNQYQHVLSGNVPYNARFNFFVEKSWYFQNYSDFLNNKHLPPHVLRYRKYFEEQPLLNGMLAYDMKTWMPENLMMKADKIMMAHSLEGRFPFLDKELFEFAALLPQKFKLGTNGITKWILKELVAPHLPKKIINRSKMGFTVPVDRLLDKLKPLVNDVFGATSNSLLSEILDTAYLKKYAQDYYEKGTMSPLQLWTLFVMCYWFASSLPVYREEGCKLPGRMT